MITLFGPCATADGQTLWLDEIGHRGPDGHLIAEQRRSYGTLRADQFDTWQPSSIPIDIGHSAHGIGEVVFLERDQNLTAVAVVDLEPEDLAAFGPAKLSTTTATNRSTGSVQLRSIGIVKPGDAAYVGLGTFSWITGDIRHGALNTIGIGQIPPVLKRAAEWFRHHRAGTHLEVVERRAVVAPAHTRVWAGDHGYDDERPYAPRSNSGRFKVIDGQRVEIFHSAPYYGVVAVR